MAITTSLTWEITNVDRDLSDGFITSANWRDNWNIQWIMQV